MHIELDTLEICIIIFWWFASKWLSRFVILGLFAKVAAKFKGKVEEKIDGIKGKPDQN